MIVIRQAQSLVSHGYKVSYILCDDLPNEEKFGIDMISVGKSEKKGWKRLLLNPIRLKRIIKKYPADVYQISEPELLPLGLFLKRKGLKVVYNLREWYPDYYARRFKKKWLQKIVHDMVELYFHHVAKRIDGVFNCMPEMYDYIYIVMPCKNFANVANFPVVNESFSLSYDEYCSRENIISYFGSIYSISCQEEFLSAIEPIKEVKYLLAGVFYSDEYRNKVMSHPAWNKVEFINGFAREELSGIINRSIMGNVMKDFNQTETPQGSYSIIKIFETMEAAVPVILSKVPLYEQMVEKYHCGICVDPHDVEGIRNAVLYLLN
ncbi:glycosyltransferase family 4 protein, partial [bacterium]|nr:glycosyltransferase family 4 protein [bacterium]